MQRLFVKVPLADGALVNATREAEHYLMNVLRMNTGDEILLFNGYDGEWKAALRSKGKKHITLEVLQHTRPQPSTSELLYCFAPLKQGRIDYLVQKAVEMGVGILQPIITQYTQIQKITLKRICANVIEAAEQCGVLNLPECCEAVKLDQLLESWQPERHLIFCDETHGLENPLTRLKQLKHGPIGLVIGPEGGFSNRERDQLRTLPFVTTISLGPRILRADTAGVAALALIQATIGDWQ